MGLLRILGALQFGKWDELHCTDELRKAERKFEHAGRNLQLQAVGRLCTWLVCVVSILME